MAKVVKSLSILIIVALVLSFGAAILSQSQVLAQPAQRWAKTYGGTNNEVARCIQQTTDGGYIVAGDATSFGAGLQDFWVVKLNPDGSVQWQKTYGSSPGNEIAYSIQQTTDGGYIVAGYSDWFGVAGDDAWVLKLDSSGSVQWQKTYGGGNNERAWSVWQTTDGGYIVAGRTNSFTAAAEDFWVLKLDLNGNVLWQQIYGGGGNERAYCVQQTTDGGYIIAGWTDTAGFVAGGEDFFVVKLNLFGSVEWQKAYGGGGDERAWFVQQTTDGGYIVAGWTDSFGVVGEDFLILKLGPSGGVQWQKTYGGTGDDDAWWIQQTIDGGYIVVGRTNTWGAGGWDFWALKLDSSGGVQWQKTYGGGGRDDAWSVLQTQDGGYIVAGQTRSFGAGVAVGTDDFWVMKLSDTGSIAADCPLGEITAATVAPQTVTVANTVATATATSATAAATAVMAQDSPCIVATQCQYSPPILTIAKSDSVDPVDAGSQLTYTVNYGNTGTVANGVVVKETYDPNVNFVSATPAPDTGTTDTWTFGTLVPGASGSISITVTVGSPLPGGTILHNVVDINCIEVVVPSSATQDTTVAAPPTVSTNDATNMTTTSAILNGNLTSLGSASLVNVSFEWGLTTAYGNGTTPQAMTAPGPFSFNLTGLAQNTTCHFRAKAVGDGTSYGADKSFTIGAGGDILAYYRGLGSDPNVVETTDLLNAIGDWAGGTIPPGFTQAISTMELLQLIGDWASG